MTGEVIIHSVGTEDAPALAAAWIDFGRAYAEIEPQHFREPAFEGLAGWFERSMAEWDDDDALWLVAERDERLVGFIQARVWAPADDAERHLMTEMSESLLKVDSVMVVEDGAGRDVGPRARCHASRRCRSTRSGWGIGATRSASSNRSDGELVRDGLAGRSPFGWPVG
jgi:hypothetical protein